MNTYPYIRDGGFRHGFSIHGASHEEGIVARYPGESAGEPADWILAQWDVKRHPLTADTPRQPLSGGFCYQTPSVSAAVLREGGADRLRLELRSSAEYEGRLRRPGEAWPHLLAEQAMDERLPGLWELSRLEYRADLRLEAFSGSVERPGYDPEIHAAQVVHFFTVQHMDSGEFIWFGIPFFDSRYPIHPGYIGMDGGKDDASGKLIYTCPQTDFQPVPASRGNWVSYRRDLLPLISRALAEARRQGLPFDGSLQRMRLTSHNLGWEMFAEHDGAFSMRNLSLTGFCQEAGGLHG